MSGIGVSPSGGDLSADAGFPGPVEHLTVEQAFAVVIPEVATGVWRDHDSYAHRFHIQ